MRLFPYLFLLVSIPCGAWAEEARYERAKVPLQGEVSRSVPLQEEADSASPAKVLLNPKSEIVVIGRKGPWYLVEAGAATGWLPAQTVRIVGRAPTAEKSADVTPLPIRPKAVPGRKSMRLAARSGFAPGLKDFPDQLRVGTELLFRAWGGAEAGSTLDLGFGNGFLLGLGPTFAWTLPWPSYASFRLAPFGGARFYYISGQGRRLVRGGVAFGTNLQLWSVGPLVFLLGLAADVIMFGEGTVSVPLGTTAGASFRF